MSRDAARVRRRENGFGNECNTAALSDARDDRAIGGQLEHRHRSPTPSPEPALERADVTECLTRALAERDLQVGS